MIKLAKGTHSIAYPILWFMLAYFASCDVPIYAVLAIILYLCIHTALFISAPKQSYILMYLMSFLYGLCVETLIKSFSILEYAADGNKSSIFPPYWVLFLYPLFATTCSLFFSPLKKNLLISSLLGCLFGPLAYYNASNIGAVYFPQTLYFSWFTLSLLWLFTFPFMIYLTNTCRWYEDSTTKLSGSFKFSFETSFPVSVERLFSWHERVDAIEKMIPPKSGVELIQKGKSLREGEEVHLRIHLGLFSFLWIARHRAYIQNRMFEDVQVKGPFKKWHHKHLFFDKGESQSILRDEIEISLPFSQWTHPLFANLILSFIQNAFEQRHNILKKEFFAEGQGGLLDDTP